MRKGRFLRVRSTTAERSCEEFFFPHRVVSRRIFVVSWNSATVPLSCPQSWGHYSEL